MSSISANSVYILKTNKLKFFSDTSTVLEVAAVGGIINAYCPVKLCQMNLCQFSWISPADIQLQL